VPALLKMTSTAPWVPMSTSPIFAPVRGSKISMDGGPFRMLVHASEPSGVTDTPFGAPSVVMVRTPRSIWPSGSSQTSREVGPSMKSSRSTTL
jgi:hypothetical protein